MRRWGGILAAVLLALAVAACTASPQPSPTVTSDAGDRLSVGAATSCVIAHSGELYCWGAGNWGQLGVGTVGRTRGAVAVPLHSTVVSVSNGVGHTCAALDDGRVWCWGESGLGEVGHGVGAGTDHPIRVEGVEHAVRVATATGMSCALIDDGGVTCWGALVQTSLGNSGSIDTAAVSIPLPGPAVDVQGTTGGWCALGQDGEVWCWGAAYAASPAGLAADGGASSQVRIDGVADAVQLAVGDAAACAVSRSQTLMCWGGIVDGPGPSWRDTAVVVMPGAAVVNVSVGDESLCAVTAAGGVECWRNIVPRPAGEAAAGLGEPEQVPLDVEAVEVGAGQYVTCAAGADESVWCWGLNSRGSLGDGSDTYYTDTPVRVIGIGGSRVRADGPAGQSADSARRVLEVTEVAAGVWRVHVDDVLVP